MSINVEEPPMGLTSRERRDWWKAQARKVATAAATVREWTYVPIPSAEDLAEPVPAISGLVEPDTSWIEDDSEDDEPWFSEDGQWHSVTP